MRHNIKIDGMRILDIGQAVPPVQIDHGAIGTPPELGGSVVDFLVRWHPTLRSLALDLIIQQHSLLFHYEDGEEALERLEILLSGRCMVREREEGVREELWCYGDALRLELVLKSPVIQNMDHEPPFLVEFAVTEMIRNAYRRLHALEHPLTEWFFNVFLQTSQPTQIPLDVLCGYTVDNKRPTPAEAATVMKENSTYWKAELQSLGNQYLLATVPDPKLMTLQNAALYQQLKRFFGEEA